MGKTLRGRLVACHDLMLPDAEAVCLCKNNRSHFFKDGEVLTVFDEDEKIVFEGAIEKMDACFENFARHPSYPPFTWSWRQEGFTLEEWEKLCEKKFRAEVVVK